MADSNPTTKTPSVPRPVPVALWGKDHWSTLAFVAHHAADAGADGLGLYRHRRQMRCDPARHVAMAHDGWRSGEAGSLTRLAGGALLPDHDDWDCLDDAEAADLVELCGTGARPVLFMTFEGLRLASQITAHKTRGGSFADFAYEEG